MLDIIRDSPIGPLLRAAFGATALPFTDEKADFTLPDDDKTRGKDQISPDDDSHHEVKPTVDWYHDLDPDNPKNYSTSKKCFITFQTCFLTFTVYSSTAILTPAEGYFRSYWGATEQTALLVLSMPLVGYALGPLLFSPLSEIPRIGRNGPYLVSLTLFIVLTIAGATVTNFPGLVVIRLLQGFLGSPVLATGGASAGDMFELTKLPYALAAWGLFAFGGPGVAPVMTGFAIEYSTWRWGMYETLILSGISWVMLVVCYPETNAETILLRRAQRLRRSTGRDDLFSKSESKQKHVRFLPLVGQYLTTPFRITFLDPSIGFINLYTAILYGIFYSFFESVPPVYLELYGFSLGFISMTFLTLLVGAAISLAIYVLLLTFIYEPYTAQHGIGVPEYRLTPGIFASILAPVGVFIFAWTASPDIHWIVPLIGPTLLSGSCAMLYMLIFLYLPLSYPQHAASLFAANTFFRSAFTAGAIHFSTPMFKNLGPGRGNSILGGLLVGCFFAFLALWHWGPVLRARSRFAEKY